VLVLSILNILWSEVAGTSDGNLLKEGVGHTLGQMVHAFKGKFAEFFGHREDVRLTKLVSQAGFGTDTQGRR